MEITVSIKNVYGQDLIYPACKVSQVLTLIKGSKTLSRIDIENLKRLDWTIKVKAQEL